MPEEAESNHDEEALGVIGAVSLSGQLAGAVVRKKEAFQAFIDQEKSISFQNFNDVHVKIFQLEDKRKRYLEFVKDLFGLNDDQAADAYKDILIRQFRDASSREKYVNRPEGEDAIEFYKRVWVSDLSSGSVNRHDVIRNDPDLIEAVRNRANRRARLEGGVAQDFYPPCYPPPHGPDRTLPSKVEQQRARNRERRSVKTPRPRQP